MAEPLRLVPGSWVDGDGRTDGRAELVGASRSAVSEVHLAVRSDGAGTAHSYAAAPFVPIATVAAIALGRDLSIEAPVTARQLDGVRSAAAILAGWLGRPVPCIDAAEVADDAPSGDSPQSLGLFFTTGVDSWASLLRLGDRVTDLVYLDGVEPLHDVDTRSRVVRHVTEAAHRVGRPLIVVETDARSLLDRLVNWELSHGAVLAAAALAIRPSLDEVRIASSFPPEGQIPWGTHPDLDHHWSTPTTAFVHDAAHVRRWDKIRLITEHPEAIETLHVCWEGGTERNCGRCGKCQMALITLDALGALDRCPRFDRRADPREIAARPARELGTSPSILEMLSELPERSPYLDAYSVRLPAEELRQFGLRPSRPGRLRYLWHHHRGNRRRRT